MKPNRSRSGPGRRPARVVAPDHRERRDLQRDRGGARPLADDDVDPEVLHREVEHLLGGARHPVDLVDEEDVAVVHPGEDRGQVAGVGERRAAGDPERHADLGGDDHRQRGLAEPRRAGEEHVVGRAVAQPRGLEHQAELVADPLLPDHLVEGARPERGLDDPLVGLGVGSGEVVAAGAFPGSPRKNSSSAPSAPSVFRGVELMRGSASGGPRAAGRRRRAARRPGRPRSPRPGRPRGPASRDR